MMELIILIISSILIFSGVPSNAEELRFHSSEKDSDDSENSIQRAWSVFKAEHEKSYSSREEDERRRLIFEESLKIVQSHNYLYETGRSSYEMGINKFSDMEFSEMLEMTGYVESDVPYTGTKEEITLLPDNSDPLPNSIDWEELGYVTEVKDQGRCGSCWAFSATGSLEGQWKRKTGRLVSLSEQNLVDCSWAQGNHGCKGGWMQSAFEYIRINGGLDTEACYPYETKNATCRYKPRPNCRGATVSGFVNLKSGSEEALTKAIGRIGPISVAISISGSFFRYKKGVYEDPSSNKMHLNHAVLAVGYGNAGERAYYTIKNSWGVTWGWKGYVLLPRNEGNKFGIASAAIYPVV